MAIFKYHACKWFHIVEIGLYQNNTDIFLASTSMIFWKPWLDIIYNIDINLGDLNILKPNFQTPYLQTISYFWHWITVHSSIFKLIYANAGDI
jgi:hypothetical protein